MIDAVCSVVYPAGENKETVHESAREWDERWVVAGRILLLSLLGSLLLCNNIYNQVKIRKKKKNSSFMQCCGSGSALMVGWIGYGSRRARNNSCFEILDVLFSRQEASSIMQLGNYSRRPWDEVLQFVQPKKKFRIFSTSKMTNFRSVPWIRIRIDLKYQIRIRIKTNADPQQNINTEHGIEF